MKKQFYISGLLLLLIVGVLYAATEIQYFTAKSEPDAILLEWKTGTEDNLDRFEIERAASDPNNFVQIGSVRAIGSNSYYFFNDEMNANVLPPIYYYRLKLINTSGAYTYSNTITVTHIISGVRSTWGSIKAIFR
ncbi:MAG: hypothetical protein EHM58_05740 [Ignavibacteriae bacterium]|nr:MAG: hypothetical protein EHM58_05740 [Ignavibacteriota bacterium]